MIIQLKHFLGSILDQEFVIYVWENGVLAFIGQSWLLDLIFQPPGNFSCVPLQIKEQELWWNVLAIISKSASYLYDIGKT